MPEHHHQPATTSRHLPHWLHAAARRRLDAARCRRQRRADALTQLQQAALAVAQQRRLVERYLVERSRDRDGPCFTAERSASELAERLAQLRASARRALRAGGRPAQIAAIEIDAAAGTRLLFDALGWPGAALLAE
jgi:hypothetical protein